MSKPTTKALVTLSNLKTVPAAETDQLPTVGNLDALFAKANAQYAAIKQGDRAVTLRAIFLGILFWQIKNECPKGEFMKLASERMPEIARQTRQDYMKLAIVFVEKTRLALPSHFEIPDAQLALSIEDSAGSKHEMVTKAFNFIGTLTLTELMIKHGIRGVGMAAALAEGEGAKPAPNEADEFFGALSEKLYGLRTFATDPKSIMRLTPEQLVTVDQTITDTYSQWKRQYAEAKGEKKAS
jgi:hypothetical protein